MAGGEKLALRQAFRELEESYSRKNASLRRSRFVCDFSSNDLSLEDVNQFATWLEGSSLRIFALDLSFNRIFSESWAPILRVIGRLDAHVDNLQLGGNYLPVLTETDELKELQRLGWVSLALPITGSPATEWQENWNNIAVDFGAKAYVFDALDDGYISWLIALLFEWCGLSIRMYPLCRFRTTSAYSHEASWL